MVFGVSGDKCLLEHNQGLHTALFLSGKLTSPVEEIHRLATKVYDRLVKQLKERDGITEKLKTQNQMEWVQ